MKHWNWGLIIGYFSVVQCLAAGVGYYVAKDLRRAIYYVLAAAITLTIVWPGAPK